MSLFGSNATEFGGVFSGGDAKLTLDNGDVDLIQNFQIQYQLQFQPVYEFGSKKIWFSKTPGAGTITINRMVGGSDILSSFGTDCKGSEAEIEIKSELGCAKTGGKTIKLHHLFLTGVQFSGQAGQAYVLEGVTGTFVDIDI